MIVEIQDIICMYRVGGWCHVTERNQRYRILVIKTVKNT